MRIYRTYKANIRIYLYNSMRIYLSKVILCMTDLVFIKWYESMYQSIDINIFDIV